MTSSKDVVGIGSTAGHDRRPPWQRLTFALACICLLLLGGASSALASEGNPAPGSPAAEEELFDGFQAAIEAGNPQQSEASVDAALTNADAAEELPHRELGRSEALELMQRVFASELQAPAGIFDELEVERFASNYAAVIPAGSRLAPSGVVVGGGEAAPEGSHAALLESTMPLRTPDALGREQPVDLSLEHSEGEIQPANPVVEVGLPAELGEGIGLPEAGIQIELLGAPQERAPSTFDQSVAGYPEVAKDTSLAVAPTPRGVETMTLLQSADSPRSESFRLDLPDGATLQQAEGGGAEVLSGEEALLVVEPPTAIDAAGQSVPVSLEVSGETLTLHASPSDSATFPILLDPVYDTFNWNGVTTTSGSWAGVSYNGGIGVQRSASCSNTTGAVNQCGTPLTQNTPGLYASAAAGATLKTGSWGQLTYFVPRAGSDYSAYGALPSSFIESMTINHLGFWHRSDPSASPYLGAGIWAGAEAPAPGANPAGWASLLTWGGNQGDINETLQYTFPGNNNHNAKEALVGMVATEPHTMSAYRDALFREVTISVGDVDNPGFGSIAPPSGWVDQTASPISFTASDSGLGVSSLSATDRQTPQHSWTTSAGCAGTNDNPCPHTWKSTDAGRPALKYEPSVLPNGINTLDVKAADPLGNVSATTSVQVKVDHTAPGLALSGSMTEQATLGASRPQYVLKYNATDGLEEQTSFLSSFGTAGTGNGQFSHPADVAIEADGTRWVVDQENNRIEKLDGSGQFLKAVGSYGSGNGQLNAPSAIAVDPEGHVWVADKGNSRIEEFSKEGEYMAKFGSYGGGNGQFYSPEGIAIDAKGNIWVASSASGLLSRLQKFNSKGEFLKLIASGGTGPGQVKAPSGLDVDSAGNLWVADKNNLRVEEFNEAGEFVRQWQGAGGAAFKPYGIDFDPKKGTVWVGDIEHNRVEGFSQSGELIAQFGSEGTGDGQFKLSASGLQADPSGAIWVTDTGNNRIQQWAAPRPTQSGVASTTIKVDNAVVASPAPGCTTGNCAMAGEWALNSSAYAPGTHTVAVTATDAAGHSTSKELTINVQRDTAKPTFGMGGEVQKLPTAGSPSATTPSMSAPATVATASRKSRSW